MSTLRATVLSRCRTNVAIHAQPFCCHAVRRSVIIDYTPLPRRRQRQRELKTRRQQATANAVIMTPSIQ